VPIGGYQLQSSALITAAGCAALHLVRGDLPVALTRRAVGSFCAWEGRIETSYKGIVACISFIQTGQLASLRLALRFWSKLLQPARRHGIGVSRLRLWLISSQSVQIFAFVLWRRRLDYVAAVDKLKQQYGWCLLTSEDWRARALALRPDPESPEQARRVCLAVYAEVLYAACQRPELVEQAYLELYNYLWPVAWHLHNDDPNALAQEALVRVFESFQASSQRGRERCRQPKAFLAFAIWQLRAGQKSMLRQEARLRRESPLEEENGEPGESQPNTRRALIQEAEILEEISQERAQHQAAIILRVAQAVLGCLYTAWAKTRLRKQMQVVVYTFFDRLGDLDLSAQLHTTKNHIQVLRNRGLDKMDMCLAENLARGGYDE
jgi:hypothetical protein